MTYVATSLRARAEIAHGWNWAPGMYRCDQGWNDEIGRSWGCRGAGTREVDGQWFCEHHAQRAENRIPDYAVISCCPECQAAAGLPHRGHSPAQWYHCPACGTEWAEDTMPSSRPDGAQLVAVGVWLAFLAASLVGVIYLWVHGTPTHSDFVGRDLLTIAVVAVTWLAVVTIISHAVAAIGTGLGWVVRFARGL